MTNGQAFFYVALSLMLILGGYSLFLAVKLKNALDEMDRLRKENFDLRTPF